MPEGKHTPYYECLEALQGGGCPICYLGRRNVARYLDSLIYEHVNDPKTRERTRTAQGFCRLHAWQLRQHGGALGIAIIYRDVVRDVAVALRNAEFNGKGRRSAKDLLLTLGRGETGGANPRLVQSLSATSECPACSLQHEVERSYITVLLENLFDERMGQAFESSDGLCLPHLRQALGQVSDEQVFQRLVAVETRIFERLLADLDEMIRLSDYRYQDERLGDVGDAWLHAISQIAGREGLA